MCDESERGELQGIKEWLDCNSESCRATLNVYKLLCLTSEQRFSELGGYIRFSILWELWHITMCRVPIVMFLLVAVVMAIGTLVLWAVNGVTVITCSLSTAAGLVVWGIVTVVARCVWQRSALHKQRKRQKLLNE